MDNAMHLLAMELNLEKGLLDLMVANAVVERKTWAAMQYEVQTEELLKISWQSVEPTGNCAGFSDKYRSTIEDGRTHGTIAEQLQKMQDMADVISKLQLELRKDIQEFKLSRLQDSSTNSNVVNRWPRNEALKIQRELQQDIQAAKPGRLRDDDANSDVSNIWTGNGAPHTIAVPNQVVQEHNRDTKQQVKDAILWK